jgi:hypothetical protein
MGRRFFDSTHDILHVRRLPDRVSVDLDNLEALPLPKLDGSRQKRMSVQVDQFDPGGERHFLECSIQRAGQP